MFDATMRRDLTASNQMTEIKRQSKRLSADDNARESGAHSLLDLCTRRAAAHRDPFTTTSCLLPPVGQLEGSIQVLLQALADSLDLPPAQDEPLAVSATSTRAARGKHRVTQPRRSSDAQLPSVDPRVPSSLKEHAAALHEEADRPHSHINSAAGFGALQT